VVAALDRHPSAFGFQNGRVVDFRAMGGHEPQWRVARFGPFEVDRDAGELRTRGLRIKLQDQPFRILVFLLARPGEIVTRDELRLFLWPEGTFVDFEHSLNVAVAKLRQALGDSSETPRFIETIARRGYRFAGQIDIAAPTLANAMDSAPNSDREAASSRRFPAMPAAIAVGVSLLAASAVRWLWLGQKQETARVPVPLTNYGGSESRPSFSPDGSQVAFSWNGPQQDNTDIYVQVVGSNDALRLTSNPAAEDMPSWSPNGRWIAFVRRDPNAPQREIFVEPALGGAERRIGETFYSDQEIGPTLAWTPDSKWLAARDDRRSGHVPGLYLFSIDTEETTLLVDSRPAVLYDYGAAFASDGGRLAFCRYGRIYLVDLHGLRASGNPKLLAGDPEALALAPVSSADQRDIIFLRFTGFGSSTLWRVRANGSDDPVRIANTGSFAYFPSVAPHRLAYVERQYNSNIWRLPLNAAGARAGPPVRVIASSQVEYTPVFSPDGNSIAFGSTRAGNEQIWIAGVDGSRPVELTGNGSGLVGSPAWSPDGETIAYSGMVNGNRDVYVVSASGGRARRLTDNPADDRMPAWSADGQSIYFSSDKSGTREIWKKPARGGEEIQITRTGGFVARETQDGRYFCYVSALRGDLWVMPLEAGVLNESKRRLVARDASMHQFDVSNSGVYLGNPTTFFALLSDRTHRQPQRFFFYDFAKERVTVVAQPANQLSLGLSVSRDDRWLLFAQADSAGADLWLLENFY
jgi:Tol biopolymer transport system component/DNA-binding winged helix-turn-helix (wHTH) protein